MPPFIASNDVNVVVFYSVVLFKSRFSFCFFFSPVIVAISDERKEDDPSLMKAGTVAVKTLPDDFAATHNDSSVTMAKWGERRLLETQSEVIVRLHVAVG